MAPVGSYESLHAAIQAGADSVYFGVERLNMRAHSSMNFTLDDLAKIVAICRENGLKSYLTVNTILYDEDLDAMREILQRAKQEGVTAIIASLFGNDMNVSIADVTQIEDEAKIGEVCKDFEFTVSYKDFDTYKLSENTGKITILNFWNINCSSCIAEIPDFERFYNNYQDDVNVVFVNPTDGKTKNDEFMNKNKPIPNNRLSKL